MNLEAAAPVAPSQLDVKRISAISLDLDDTLWPVWPAIERAERVLHAWLVKEAPKTATFTPVVSHLPREQHRFQRQC